MVTFSKHKWWILTALLTAPLVAFAAGVPNMFSPNTVISSAAVNANFTNLSDRVTALETAAAAKTAITMVLDNAPGGLPIPAASSTTPASFTSAGGPTVIIVSGSGYGAAGASLDVAVQVDGAPIGHLQEYTNEAGSHKAFPTRAFKATVTAGTHNIQLLANSAATSTDSNDRFSVTVVETAH
jgi:hypothetical protein